MNILIADMVKEGKDVNEVLDMPFHFVLQILEEKAQPIKQQSLISTFGG